MKSTKSESRLDALFSINKLQKNWEGPSKPAFDLFNIDPDSLTSSKFKELDSLINKFYIDKSRLSVKLDELNDKISQLVLVNAQKLNIDDKEKTRVIEMLDQLDDLLWAMELSRTK
jgi:uncharacterized protein with von Willebrand factor type A (vWA) domain